MNQGSIRSVSAILCSTLLCFALVLMFQNCGKAFNANLAPQTSHSRIDEQYFTASVENLSPAERLPQTMVNGLATTGEGLANPAGGKLVRNIIITQIAGWSGMLSAGEAEVHPERVVDVPLYGGDSAYMSKSMATYERQADMIMKLGNHNAVGVLLMDDGDSNSSGYGACWNGTWVTDRQCKGGRFVFPKELYQNFKAAAWKKGLQVAPNFSVMNWEVPDRYNGARFLPKLKSLLEWVRPTFDGTNLRTIDRRWVVIVDSLPETAGLNLEQKRAIHEFMASQDDIFWIDNAISPGDGPLVQANNIYGSTWAPLNAQLQFKTKWGGKYLHWVVPLKDAIKKYYETAGHEHPEDDLREKLNINNYSPGKYPIVFSQFNEYAEHLYIEPGKNGGFKNYNRFKAWASAQGPNPVAYVPASESDFGSPNPEVPVVDYAAVVKAVYLSVLERQPDAEGLAYYKNKMMNGFSEAALRSELQSSNEYKYLAYYRTHLKRNPRLDEILKNNGDLSTGQETLTGLREKIRKSAECKVDCIATPTQPPPTDTNVASQIHALYMKHFGRNADAEGLQYYIGQVNGGRSLAAIEQELLNSAEKKWIGYYNLHLQRLPTLTEIRKHYSDVNAGTKTVEQIKEDLKRSPACKVECVTSSTASCGPLVQGEWSYDSLSNAISTTSVTTVSACQSFCNSRNAVCCSFNEMPKTCRAFTQESCRTRWSKVSPGQAGYTSYSGTICR